MYNPSHFNKSDDRAALLALMRAHPLGALVTHGPEGLDANHLPFEVDEAAGVLRAHVARANPLWQQVPASGGMPAMVIFRGQAGYISPNWYPRPTGTPANTKPTARCPPGTTRWCMCTAN